MIKDSRFIPGIMKSSEVTPEQIKLVAMEFYGLNYIKGRKSVRVSCKRVIVALIFSDKHNCNMTLTEVAKVLELKSHASVLNHKNQLELYISEDKSLFYRFVYLNIICELNNLKSFTFFDFFIRLNNELNNSFTELADTENLFFKKGKYSSKLRNKVFSTCISLLNNSWVQSKEIAYFLNMDFDKGINYSRGINYSDPFRHQVRDQEIKKAIIILKQMNNELKSIYENRENKN